MKLLAFFLFLALNTWAQPVVDIKPDRRIILDESAFILPHHFRMYVDPYHNNIFMQVPYGYVVYDMKGKLLKKCLYESSQEPGGLTTALVINFFEKFYYVADHFKANKYDYNHKFLKTFHVGRGIGMFATFCENGDVCFHSFLDGLVKIKVSNGSIIKNRKLLIKPKVKNSMAMFFVYPVVYFDKFDNVYYCAFKHQYNIYKINKDTLSIIKVFGEASPNYKAADDTKTNVFRRTGLEEYIKIVKGYSSIEAITSTKKYLLIYWCSRYTGNSFIDIYDKNNFKKVQTLNLAPLLGENEMVIAFDNINLKFYQEDKIESKDDEITTVVEYNLMEYVDE